MVKVSREDKVILEYYLNETDTLIEMQDKLSDVGLTLDE